VGLLRLSSEALRLPAQQAPLLPALTATVPAGCAHRWLQLAASAAAGG